MFSSVGCSDVATVASRRRPEKRDLLSPNRGEQQEREGHPSYPTTVQQVAVAACKKVPSSDNGIERSVNTPSEISSPSLVAAWRRSELKRAIYFIDAPVPSRERD